MDKIETLHKQDEFSTGQRLRTIKRGSGVKRFNPDKILLNKKLVLAGIWECLAEGDLEGAIEILKIHMRARTAAQRDRAKVTKASRKMPKKRSTPKEGNSFSYKRDRASKGRATSRQAVGLVAKRRGS